MFLLTNNKNFKSYKNLHEYNATVPHLEMKEHLGSRKW